MTARSDGFTLIELVIVILLLGILAAFAVPKWLGKGGFETHTLRDELVTRLRLVQTINMQEGPARCTQLVVESGRFGHLTQLGNCTPKAISGWDQNEQARGRVVKASGSISLPQGSFSFDKRSGRPVSPSACISGCNLMVSDGGESARLRIEPEGYIHAIP
ncbi:type IV pilin protein [Aeromonas caviae]|uniref:prepilin-type N-terminal cleavage/methylation domain-containing protein n=1 Tax=Aeromonas caviae TaxID=648 RepID=UPI003014F1E3